MAVGLRLRMLGDGTGRFTWGDLAAFVLHARPDSALRRVTDPDGAQWGLSESLLAAVVDGVNALVWQNGGGKGPRPKPVRAVGDSPDGGSSLVEGDPFNPNESGTFKGVAVPVDEINAMLGWA